MKVQEKIYFDVKKNTVFKYSIPIRWHWLLRVYNVHSLKRRTSRRGQILEMMQMCD